TSTVPARAPGGPSGRSPTAPRYRRRHRRRRPRPERGAPAGRFRGRGGTPYPGLPGTPSEGVPDGGVDRAAARRRGAAVTGRDRAAGHVVIASDKFKGSLTAAEVAAHVAAGLGPRLRTVAVPVADGGDGTVDAVVSRGFTRVRVEVPGPTGEPVTAAYAWRDAAPDGDGPVAVIELAEASGLRRLPAGPAPLTASSHGTGALIGHALRRGARRIVLGLGGSACTD